MIYLRVFFEYIIFLSCIINYKHKVITITAVICSFFSKKIKYNINIHRVVIGTFPLNIQFFSFNKDFVVRKK